MRLFVHSEVLKRISKRIIAFAVFVVFTSSVLVVRLFGLQIVDGNKYYRLSESNFVKVRRIVARRGRIFDRNGEELASNISSYSVYITPAFVKHPEETVLKLASYLELSNRTTVELTRILTKTRGLARFREYTVKTNLSRKELAVLVSRSDQLEGITIRRSFKRYYPYKDLFVHTVGYVGPPTKKDLSEERGIYRDTPVGKQGLEFAFDDSLRGKDGKKHIIVDARGVEKSNPELEKLIAAQNISPQPGLDLYTSLDVRLQETAAKAFAKFEGGAVWAMRPNTGEILVAYSKPGFDPNLLIRGIPAKLWAKLRDDVLHPLLNKGIQAAYFPGSTFKPLIAYAALAEHLVYPEERVLCTGVRMLGEHPYRCWRKAGHRLVNLHRGLKESCDVYFYELGARLGIDKIVYYAHMFGLGNRTGIELPHESRGIFPTKEWHQKVHKRPWTLGDTYNTAIGQGDVKLTPVQLLELYSALFNGGLLYKPMVALRLEKRNGEVVREFQPKLIKKLNLDSQAVAYVREALTAVVNEPGGTAYWHGRSKVVKIAGKTGTAQVVGLKNPKRRDEHEQRFLEQDHALFVGFAPPENPQIVVVAVAEHGGHGFAAAEVVRAVIERYFEIQAERKTTKIQR